MPDPDTSLAGLLCFAKAWVEFGAIMTRQVKAIVQNPDTAQPRAVLLARAADQLPPDLQQLVEAHLRLRKETTCQTD